MKGKARVYLRRRIVLLRCLHVLVVLLLTLGIFWGASWLYEHNYTNAKTFKVIALSYKDRYDFARYQGKSKTQSIKSIFGDHMVGAVPNTGMTDSVPVLLYHRISADGNPFSVPLPMFKEQMFALKNAGYHAVSIYDYVAFLQGEKTLPPKSFLLTFDDGAKESYYPVQPILSALNYKATMFIITRYSVDQSEGSHYYLSSIELQQMNRSKQWDIQPHTRDGHTYYAVNAQGAKGEFYPDRLWLSSLRRQETDAEYAKRVGEDMALAKKETQQLTKKPVVAFAFPFGNIGEQNSSNYAQAEAVLTQDVRRLFQTAMLQYFGGRGASQNYFGSRKTYTYRIEVGQQWSGQELLYQLQRGTAKALPYRDDFTSDKGWLRNNGAIQAAEGQLVIYSTPGTTGGSALLDGTSDWQNYTSEATVTLQSGTSFALSARNQNGGVQVGCNFSRDYLAIYQASGSGDTYTILRDDNFYMPVNEPQRLAVRVSGNTLDCLANGHVLATITTHLPASGGPGFSVWDPQKPSKVTVKDVYVFADD